jgi:mRNA-degrading endonuclease toxin of MazEF toxin-antitoxin module
LTVFLRGELWDIRLPSIDIQFPVQDWEEVLPGKPDIGLIVSMDVYNQSALHTVTVALITPGVTMSTQGQKAFVIPSNSTSGLALASVADLSQLLTLEKSCLLRRRGNLDAAGVVQLNLGLKRVLAQE